MNSHSTGHSLSEEFRADLRFFAFLLGNGTLLINETELEYGGALARKDDALGRVFAVFVNRWQPGGDPPRPKYADRRAAQWLRRHCDPAYTVLPPFEAWETEIGGMQPGWRESVKGFAHAFGTGTLAPDVLGGVEYVEWAADPMLEAVFAVLGNVLRMDEEGRVLNEEQAWARAAQMIRMYADKGYEVQPSFEAWETELL